MASVYLGAETLCSVQVLWAAWGHGAVSTPRTAVPAVRTHRAAGNRKLILGLAASGQELGSTRWLWIWMVPGSHCRACNLTSSCPGAPGLPRLGPSWVRVQGVGHEGTWQGFDCPQLAAGDSGMYLSPLEASAPDMLPTK